MIIKGKIFSTIAALLFTAALLLPASVQFFHIFDNHTHVVCNDFSSHLHTKKLNCNICEFHFSNFQFTPFNYPDFQIISIAYIQPSAVISSIKNTDFCIVFLRGPPQFS